MWASGGKSSYCSLCVVCVMLCVYVCGVYMCVMCAWCVRGVYLCVHGVYGVYMVWRVLVCGVYVCMVCVRVYCVHVCGVYVYMCVWGVCAGCGCPCTRPNRVTLGQAWSRQKSRYSSLGVGTRCHQE